MTALTPDRPDLTRDQFTNDESYYLATGRRVAPTPEQMRVTKAGMQYLVFEIDKPERWVAVFKSAVYAVAFVANRPYLDIVQVTGLQWVQR